MNYIRKKVKPPRNVTIAQKITDFFKYDIINKMSKKLYNFCGTYQTLAIIIVVLFFVAFIGLVIIKDFFGCNGIRINFFGHNIEIGQAKLTGIINFATFLVDFATLPLVVITLMFTAHSGYGDSKLQNSVNKIDATIEGVEGKVIEMIAQQRIMKNEESIYEEKVRRQEISSDRQNLIDKDIKNP